MDKDRIVLKAVGFALVGAINVVIDATVFFAAIIIITSSIVIANILAWFVAVSSSYVLNSFITFSIELGGELRAKQYASFVGSGLVGLVAGTATLVTAADFLPMWAAKSVALGVSFALNFLLSNFVVFNTRSKVHAGLSRDMAGQSKVGAKFQSQVPDEDGI